MLPLDRHALEGAIRLPRYDAHGHLEAGWPLLVWALIVPDIRADGDSVADRARDIEAVVSDYQVSSSVTVETKIFSCPQTWHDAVQHVLTKLDLAWNRGEPDGRPVDVAASDVFAILFAAEAQGAPDGGAHQAAYARLRAWKSLARLVGCRESAALDEIAAAAERGRWIRFRAEGGLYEANEFHVGLVHLETADGEVSIVAVSDRRSSSE